MVIAHMTWHYILGKNTVSPSRKPQKSAILDGLIRGSMLKMSLALFSLLEGGAAAVRAVGMLGHPSVDGTDHLGQGLGLHPNRCPALATQGTPRPISN